MVLVLRVLEALHAEDAGEVDAAVLAAVRRLAALEQLPALWHHVAEERREIISYKILDHLIDYSLPAL